MSSPTLSLERISSLSFTGERSTGQEARTVRRLLGEIECDVLSSVALGSTRREAFESLHETAEEASAPGWDGYGATPIDQQTYANGRLFLRLLPALFPTPEIAPEADGQIEFEWRNGPRRILSISVSRLGEIHYAALFGKGSSTHGTEHLSNELPEAIAGLLVRLYKQQD
jgi:hypothetical protein